MSANKKPTAPISPARQSGKIVYLSGQIHLKPDGTLEEGSISDKTHQVMQNLHRVLTTENLSFDQVIKSTIYLTDMSVYAEVNKVYASYFKGVFPAREVVCVTALPLHASVEISLIASH